MPDTSNPLANVRFTTDTVPSVYANHVNPTISFSEIRIYLSEVLPREVEAIVPDKPSSIAPAIQPKMCIVLTPEFAKNVAQTLSRSLEKYEELFGPLRPQPDQVELNKKLAPK